MVQVEWILGWFYLVVGISLLLQTKLWMDYMRVLYAQPSMLLAQGFITLILGLIIITMHPQWFMGPGVIATIIGWLACVKGALLLWCPQQIIRLFPLKRFGTKFLRIESLIIILIGAVLIYFARYW